MYKSWTEEEVNFLKREKSNLTASQMAERLGRSESSVYSKVRYLNKTGTTVVLQKSGDDHHLTMHEGSEVELCRQLHDENLTCREIAEKMELPFGTVQDWCYYQSRRS